MANVHTEAKAVTGKKAGASDGNNIAGSGIFQKDWDLALPVSGKVCQQSAAILRRGMQNRKHGRKKSCFYAKFRANGGSLYCAMFPGKVQGQMDVPA